MRILFGAPVLALALLMPSNASARVLINEIAWMGSEAGATCEWIELYNDSDEDVSLSGWTIEIENESGTKNIVQLSKASNLLPEERRYESIPANGLFLVARSGNASDGCADALPGTIADWLGSFGSGISNTGARLVLRSPDNEEDRANDELKKWTGSDGFGGTNPSNGVKKTPQRLQNGQWTTAEPTPRAWYQGPQSEAPDMPADPDEGTATSSPVVTIGGTAPSVAPPPYALPKLYLVTGPNRIVVSGPETPFRAHVFDERGQHRSGATVWWSFGDGMRQKGQAVAHRFSAPGEYLVAVRAEDGKGSVIKTLIVTVVASEVSIASIEAGGIRLRNGHPHFADISGWELHAGGDFFRVPEDTALLPGRDVLFSWDVMRMASSSEAVLAYPGGREAFAYAPPALPSADEQDTMDG